MSIAVESLVLRTGAHPRLGFRPAGQPGCIKERQRGAGQRPAQGRSTEARTPNERGGSRARDADHAQPTRDAASPNDKGFNYDGIPKALLRHCPSPGKSRSVALARRGSSTSSTIFPSGPNQSISTSCCFGRNLPLADPRAPRFARQVGVDILPEQVGYANAQYRTSFRSSGK